MTNLPDPSELLDHPERWGEEESRTVTWHPPGPVAAAGLQMSGLDYLRAMGDGRLPMPPISQLVGLIAVSADPGEVRFTITPDGSTYNPIGLVHGGVICTVLDSAAACAVHTLLPAGVGYTSTSITVNYLRPAPVGEELSVRGWVTKPGKRVMFAEAELLTAAGKQVATASTSCLVFGG